MHLIYIKEFLIFVCSKRNFLVMDKKIIYTSGEYLENNPSWHVEDSPWKAGQILELIRRNNLKPRSICEVGCGAGEILRQLQQQLPKVTFSGYEISPQAYKLCQQRKNSGIRFYLKNLLEDGRAFFDVVLAIDVIEHVDDYLGFLRALRGKGKYKIFHIPLDLSVQTVWREKPISKLRRTVGHLHYFTKETALAALSDNGYKIVDYFYTSAAVDLPARSFISWLGKLPRKIMFKLNPDLTARLLGRYSLMVLTK